MGTIREATGGVPETSPRYREVVIPSGFEHEMRIVFRHQGRPWGAIVLLRADDSPAFTARDAELMAAVSTPMATAIKRGLLQDYVEAGGVPDHAGLLLLDDGFRIETVDPGGVSLAGAALGRRRGRAAVGRGAGIERSRTAQVRRCAAGRGCPPAPGSP